MNVPVTILLTVIFLILVWVLCDWLFGSWNYWTTRGIPCAPGPLPIFGNTLPVFLLRMNMPTLCRQLYESHRGSSMVGFFNVGRPVLLIRDPEVVKKVMLTNFHNFRHNNATVDPEMDALLSRDPLFSRDDVWKHSRAVFVATLSPARMKLINRVVADVCKDMKNYLDEKSCDKDYLEVTGKLLFSRYTTEVAARAIFGLQGDSFADDYKGTLLDSMKMILDPSKVKGLAHHVIFFLPRLRKIFKPRFIPLAVDKYFRRIVEELADRRSNEGEAGNDILQLMLDMEKREKIDRGDTLAHVITLFLDSYETSSVTLSTMFYYISKHPKVQDRLRKEVEEVLKKHEGELTYEAINELTYLDQVMYESLRIFPASGAFTRVCVEDFRLEGPDGLSVKVEAGTTVIIPVSGIQHDPDHWENPEVFDPERFAKGRGDGRHKFVHLPFSEGPRACPGQRLATIKVKAAVATIIGNYQVDPSTKTREPLRMDPTHFLSVPVGGFWYEFRKLNKN